MSSPRYPSRYSRSGTKPASVVERLPDRTPSPFGSLHGRSVSHAPRDSTDSCNATTYYGRMLHDGDMEFFKELKHPDGESRERYAIWNGNPLPHGKWIGMKFVVCNIDEDQHVKLELYRDLSEGVNGGDWEKIGETIDKGVWIAADDCEYLPDFILVVGGVVLLKTKSRPAIRGTSFSAFARLSPNRHFCCRWFR